MYLIVINCNLSFISLHRLSLPLTKEINDVKVKKSGISIYIKNWRVTFHREQTIWCQLQHDTLNSLWITNFHFHPFIFSSTHRLCFDLLADNKSKVYFENGRMNHFPFSSKPTRLIYRPNMCGWKLKLNNETIISTLLNVALTNYSGRMRFQITYDDNSISILHCIIAISIT